jgi:hypothetical protein
VKLLTFWAQDRYWFSMDVCGVFHERRMVWQEHQTPGKLSNPLNDGFGGAFPGDYDGNSWAGANTLYVT